MPNFEFHSPWFFSFVFDFHSFITKGFTKKKNKGNSPIRFNQGMQKDKSYQKG